MTLETLQERWEASATISPIPNHQEIARLRVAALADSMKKLDPKQRIAAHALVDLHLLRSGREAAYYRAVHTDADSYFLKGMVSLEMLDEERHRNVIGSNSVGLIATVASLVVPDRTFDLYRSVSNECPLVIYTTEAPI